MFSPELNRLIEASLTDGVLTEQERAVIKKRALLEGIDPDEVDLILESKLQALQLKAEEAVAKVKKCPACGAIMASLQRVCPQCGYEVSNMQANSIMQKLADQLDGASDKRKASIIKSFPIPMGKEDLLECIITMQSRWRNTSNEDSDLKGAYRAKYDEAVTKARVKFYDDPAFKDLFAQADKDNKWYVKLRHSSAFWVVIFVAGWLFLMLIGGIISAFD